MDVSIAVISYNTKDLLIRCLNSIYKHTKNLTYEIIVVDNASNDGTVELVEKKFPEVKIIKNRKNVFFTKANNQAFKIAKGRHFLILAPDSYLVDNSIKKFLDFFKENPKVGAIEGLELYENGRIVPTGSRFSTPLIDFFELSFIGKRLRNVKKIREYRLSNSNRKKTFEIDVGCDAFLCVRKEIFKEVGGYDESLLLYYTENDLCLKIKNKGYGIVHLGQAKTIHKVSSSASKIGWRKLDIYYNDLLKYYIKYGYVISGLSLFVILKIEQTLLKIFRPMTVK